LKKSNILAIAAVFLMIFAAFPALTSAQPPRPDHIIIATIGEPETVDPAWLYDTASAELCMHVYEPLINFKVDRSLPRDEQGLTGEFVRGIATYWWIEDIEETDPDTGLTWVQRYYFEIDTTIMFHDGSFVTTEDVEYTFERWMVQCRSGGPTWMILEPTLGVYSTRGKTGDEAILYGKMIDHAVESNATHVWFNLVMPYAPLPAIIAQSWAGIMSKSWCIAHGDFPGFDVTGYTGWVEYNDPDVSPLDDYPPGTGGTVMMGAGPYKFDYWTKMVEWSLIKFDDYYGGWPATVGGVPNDGYVSRVTEKFIPEWATRKMMFLRGDCDFVAVPRPNLVELWLNYPTTPEEYPPGVRCDPGLPQLVCSPCFFFTYEVASTSPLLGPGFDIANPYERAEDRIPIDFFSDMNIRKGFATAFDYATFINEVYMGEAAKCPTPIVEGLPFHNPAQEGYDYDPTAAENYFKAAFGGDLWTTGFTMSLTYNTGNIPRRMACEMLEYVIEGMNSKFHIEVKEVDWPTYLKMLVSSELTGFTLGWLADFPDDHNFAMPFMHSEGDFSCFQGVQYGQSGRMQISYTVNGVPYGDPTKVIDNAYVDEMIENGVKTAITEERQVIYYELQRIYVDECIGFPLCKPVGRHWERDWVQGWYFNPIYPGIYVYHYWKEYVTTPPTVDVAVTNVAIGSNNITEWLLGQPYHAPRPPVAWIKYNPTTEGSEPVAYVNATVQRFDTATEDPITVYMMWVGNTTKLYNEQFHWDYVALYPAGDPYGRDVATMGPGNVTDEYPATSDKYSLVVWPLPGYPNANVSPPFNSGWFTAIGYCDVDGDFKCYISDVVKAIKAFGSVPGVPNWMWPCDVDCDNKVYMSDIVRVIGTFGTEYAKN